MIPEDYDTLKTEYLSLRKELDEVKQERYDQRREISRLQALENEYQNDLESLTSECSSIKKKYQDQIAQLEEASTTLRSKYNSRLQELESDISNKSKENALLQEKIEELNNRNTVVEDNEDKSLTVEIELLKQENDTYRATIEEMTNSFDIFKKQYEHIEELQNEYKEEINNLKEFLSVKKEELTVAQNDNQKLHEELIFLKNELQAYKNQPLDVATKGNSLFAEVDDRRLHLQKVNQNMKKSYLSMKSENQELLDTIRRLKLENYKLAERLQSDIKESISDEASINESVRGRITHLEYLIKEYQKDLEAKPLVIAPNDASHYKYFDMMLKAKSDEMEDLRKRLWRVTRSEILIAEDIKRLNDEKRKWRNEALAKEKLLDYLVSVYDIDDIDLHKINTEGNAECRDSDKINCREMFSRYRASKRKTSAWCNDQETSVDQATSSLSETLKISDSHKDENPAKEESDSKNKLSTEEITRDDKEINKEVSEIDDKAVENKENMEDNLAKEKKNVRFTETTHSPPQGKPARRTTKIIVAKSVYIE